MLNHTNRAIAEGLFVVVVAMQEAAKRTDRIGQATFGALAGFQDEIVRTVRTVEDFVAVATKAINVELGEDCFVNHGRFELQTVAEEVLQVIG